MKKIKEEMLHAIGLCCCEYFVIIPVQPTDGSVNMLFDSCVVDLMILYLADVKNEGSKVNGGPVIRPSLGRVPAYYFQADV